MTDESAGGDTPQSTLKAAWKWWSTATGGLMLLALVFSVAMMGVNVVSGEDPIENDRTAVVIGEGAYEGSDVVEDVSRSQYGNLRINLSEKPSEAGISKVYLYEKDDDEIIDQKSLTPLQTSVVLSPIELGTDYRVVAVDGSNNAVYDGIIYYKEAEYVVW